MVDDELCFDVLLSFFMNNMVKVSVWCNLSNVFEFERGGVCF